MIQLVPFLLGGVAVLIAKPLTKSVAKGVMSVKRDMGEAVGSAEAELEDEVEAEFQAALAKREAFKRRSGSKPTAAAE